MAMTSVTTMRAPLTWLTIFPVLIMIIAMVCDAHIDGSLTQKEDLIELLRTEGVLIDTIRESIEVLEDKIFVLKSKTSTIDMMHEEAFQDTKRYVNNPLNSLLLLKRFSSDWNRIRDFARDNAEMEKVLENLKSTIEPLRFPSEVDLDKVVNNLLRLQDIYNLQPERLAVGELNGIKLGSEMSWSDCLEIGRKSDKNGDYQIAKYWIETALRKISPAAPSTEVKSINDTQLNTGNELMPEYEVMGTLLKIEFNVGNNEKALHIIDEMIKMWPGDQGLLKDKTKIVKKIQKSATAKKKTGKNKIIKKSEKDRSRTPKSVKTELIEGICREAIAMANLNSSFSNSIRVSSATDNERSCFLKQTGTWQDLILPRRVEILRKNPYIIMLHNVLTDKQIVDLANYVDYYEHNVRFTMLGRKKLKHITTTLADLTGHRVDLFEDWRLEENSFENVEDYESSSMQQFLGNQYQAKILFNLQAAKLGGTIVFPQLELGIELPRNSILYWKTLNEFEETDYRGIHQVCPLIAGTQLTAFSAIQKSAIYI